MRMSRREKGKHYQKVNLHGSGGAVVVIQFCVLLAHPTANTILVVTTYDKQPRNTHKSHKWPIMPWVWLSLFIHTNRTYMVESEYYAHR